MNNFKEEVTSIIRTFNLAPPKDTMIDAIVSAHFEVNQDLVREKNRLKNNFEALTNNYEALNRQLVQQEKLMDDREMKHAQELEKRNKIISHLRKDKETLHIYLEQLKGEYVDLVDNKPEEVCGHVKFVMSSNAKVVEIVSQVQFVDDNGSVVPTCKLCKQKVIGGI